MPEIPRVPPPADPDGAAGLNLQQHLDVLRKHKWLILAASVVLLAGSALWTFSRVRIYQASAAVLVNRYTPEVLGSKVHEVVDPNRESYWQYDEHMQNQIAVACSTAVATRAASRLNLAANARFWGFPRRRPATVEQAAAALLGRTRCSARRKTTILDISVEHDDPAVAADLANAMASAYVDQNLETKLSSTTGAVEWLAKRLDEMRGQLDTSEKQLYEFKRSNNLLAVPLSGQQNLLTRHIERFNDELASVRVRRMALYGQLQQLKESDQADPLQMATGPLLDTPVMDRLKTAYIEERRRYLALRERYLDKHPLVAEQRTRMTAAADDVRREVRSRLEGLRVTYQQALKQEQQLAAAIDSVKRDALELSRKEQAYQQLKRPVETTSQLYDLLLTRMKESNIAGQLRVNNLELLERAVKPFAPISPRVRLNLLIGLLLGLLAGVGLAFLREALDASVRSEEDVTAATGLVCLGAVPSIKNQVRGSDRVHPLLARSPALIVHHRPLSVPAEAVRAVRTNLLFSSPDRPLKTIVVTSAGPEEGKTTIAVGLAAALAQGGKPILLVDGDLRQPRMHTIFGLPRGNGITCALRGDTPVDELVCATEVPNLFVLPCGPIPPNPAELCQSERLQSLLQQLGARFERVIIDSPPVLLVTDAVLLSARFDGTLLVVRTGRTVKKIVLDCYRQIGEVGGRVIGCVLNDRDLTQRGYRYYPYRRRAYLYGSEAAERARPGVEG